VGPMVIMTEYKTKAGKRNELFQLFERLLGHGRAFGQDCLVWSNSATDRNASFLFEYWSDAESFADLARSERFVEYIAGVDRLVKVRPVTTAAVPQFVDGVPVRRGSESA
jgi:quinol monooxygenase YgiN